MTVDDDNPFQPRSTIIRPNPGGRAGPSRAPINQRASIDEPLPIQNSALGPSPSAWPGPSAAERAELPGFGSLTAAASLLLAFASWVRQLPEHRDLPGLFRRLLEELERFGTALRAAGESERSIQQADYLLCATLDDVIANTPWGSQGEWSRRSLARTRHNDSTGGDQVFRLITEYRRNPATYRAGIELAYLCLTLGFEGRLRIAAQGQVEHLQLRRELLELIRQAWGELGRDLSPQWRSETGAPQRRSRSVPIWVSPAIAAGLLGLIYAALVWNLTRSSDRVRDEMAALPPSQLVAFAVPPPPEPHHETSNKEYERIRGFLEPEIAQHLVTVLDDDGRNITVRMVGSGMFASLSAALEPKFDPVINDLARALIDTKGPILVTGHTDNQPIRFSVKFASNMELSRARAKTVADLLKSLEPQLAPRLTAEGRADQESIDPRNTPEGWANNRRIDLIVPKQF